MPTDHDALALDLNALAVEEQFLAEWRAGKRPRLNVYIKHYPACAGALANLVASLSPDAATIRSPDESSVSSTTNAWAEAGEHRALTALFDALPDESTESNRLRVAEERGEYNTGWKQGASLGDGGTDTRS